MIVYNYHLVNYNHQVMLEGGLPMSDKQLAAMLSAVPVTSMGLKMLIGGLLLLRG